MKRCGGFWLHACQSHWWTNYTRLCLFDNTGQWMRPSVFFLLSKFLLAWVLQWREKNTIDRLYECCSRSRSRSLCFSWEEGGVGESFSFFFWRQMPLLSRAMYSQSFWSWLLFRSKLELNGNAFLECRMYFEGLPEGKLVAVQGWGRSFRTLSEGELCDRYVLFRLNGWLPVFGSRRVFCILRFDSGVFFLFPCCFCS